MPTRQGLFSAAPGLCNLVSTGINHREMRPCYRGLLRLHNVVWEFRYTRLGLYEVVQETKLQQLLELEGSYIVVHGWPMPTHQGRFSVVSRCCNSY